MDTVLSLHYKSLALHVLFLRCVVMYIHGPEMRQQCNGKVSISHSYRGPDSEVQLFQRGYSSSQI
jgi:hypothetical protein